MCFVRLFQKEYVSKETAVILMCLRRWCQLSFLCWLFGKIHTAQKYAFTKMIRNLNLLLIMEKFKRYFTSKVCASHNYENLIILNWKDYTQLCFQWKMYFSLLISLCQICPSLTNGHGLHPISFLPQSHCGRKRVAHRTIFNVAAACTLIWTNWQYLKASSFYGRVEISKIV